MKTVAALGALAGGSAGSPGKAYDLGSSPEPEGGAPSYVTFGAVKECIFTTPGDHTDSGGAKGNRTPDLLDANETRYQLRYSPSWVARLHQIY